MKPKIRLITRNGCSPLARTLDLAVFFAFCSSVKGWLRVPFSWVKSCAAGAAARIAAVCPA